MDYLYSRIMDQVECVMGDRCCTRWNDTALRQQFREHLIHVARALKAIEWNDSGDGDDEEDAVILAALKGRP